MATLDAPDLVAHVAFKRYLLLLAGLALAMLLLLALTAVYIQPLHGDLTRLGSYAERDFGWISVQKSLGKGVRLEKQFDRYFDIVVVGDSFSKEGLWQSFLRSVTGYTFTTLDLITTSLDQLVSSDSFVKHPPRIMIVEIGERLLLQKFPPGNASCSQPAPARRVSPGRPAFVRQPVPLEDWVRRQTARLEDINLKYALLYIRRSLARYLIKEDFTQVARYSLSRRGLFSNRRDDQMLIYKDDLVKATWTRESIRAAACSIRKLQDRVQENGKTLFVLLLIPDKSTAYAEYIVEPKLPDFPRAHPVLAEQGITLLRADVLLQDAIGAGETDVYLPNDTHFGVRGYEIVARSLVDFLQ